MQQSSLQPHATGLKVFSACFLSYLLIMIPLSSLVAATRLKPQLRSGTSDAGQKSAASEKANASAKNVFVNGPVPQPAPEPLVPSITATKTDALISDDGDGKADPGNTEKIEYTVTITNTGTDATNVQFTDTIDTHTTLVNGSITTQPIAVNDSYNVLGNVRIQPNAAAGVLANDCDPDPLGGPCTNAGLTASGPTAGPAHGQATVNGDGSFSYNPTAGYEGPDSFTYTVTDGTGKTDTATVNLTVTGMIWFINSAAAAGGDGRLTTPFNCITGAGCFDSVAADDPGDNIFLFSGTYNDTAALVLLNNQKLIGAGATATLASIAGVTVPPNSDALPSTNSNPSTVTITSSVTGITLASGNTLRGFTVGNTGTAAGNYDIANTTTATVGTLVISDCVLNGTGGLFRADSGGTLNVTFNSADTTSAGSNGVQLNNTIGSFTINGSGTISGVTGVNFLVSGGSPAISCGSNLTKTSSGRLVDFSNYDTSTATISGNLSCTSSCAGVQVTNDGSSSGTVNFSGGTKTLNTSTNTAVNLDNNDGGNVNFTNGGLDIDTTSGTGFNAINGGTVTVQGSINTITSTTGTGLNVANTTIGASGLTFRSISVDGTDVAPTNGIVLNNTGTSGGLSVTGTGSAGTGGTIQDASGNGISLTTTEKVSLSFMNITSNLGSGIGGSGINGLQLASCSITSNGDSAASDESGINVTQLTGTNSAGARPTSITNTTISNNFEFQIQITNSSGTLTDLTMSGNTISTSAPAVSGNLFNFLGNGSASMKLTLTSGSFTGNWTPAAPIPGPAVISGTAISAVTQGTGGHTVNVSGATFTNNNAGVDCSTTNVSNTFGCNVSNNNFQGSRAVAINSFHNGNAPFTRTFNGTFSNNIIGTAGSANSGSFNGRGIDISNEGVITTANYTISGNTIAEVGTLGTAGAEGIGVNVGLGGQATGGGATNVTISGNTIRDIRNSRALIVSDNQDPAFAPFPFICANISGNTFTGTIAGQAGNGQFMRIRELSGTVNVTQAQATAAANAAELDDANGFNDTTKISISGTPQFSQAACTTSTALPSTSALEPLQYGPSNSSDLAAIDGFVTTGETSTNAELSQPSLWARAYNVIASITEEVGSLIEPTAHASAGTETTAQRGQLSRVESHHASLANAGRKSGENNHKPEVRTHVARNAPTLTAPVAGEMITINIGTLRQNDSVTITFQVTVNNPPNLTLLNPPRVRNQGTVTANGGISVMTDDTALGGPSDPTDTEVDLFDTTTSLISDLNPSNFGDLVTFTATVAESPTQASADPTGTVDFIDTSNGNAVICNDVPLNGSFQAQCQSSTLTAGTHNIRADYSGDGNFDPSASNVVAQVVNACTPNPIVTSTADSGAGTLREALANACSGNTITFDLAGAGPHTITLTTGELVVAKNVTINNSSGESITVSGNNASRVFNVNSGKTAAILGLTISGGSDAANDGGGIKNSGTLTLRSCNVYGNTAGVSGGISNVGTLTIDTCNIGGTLAGQPNTATVNSGGGIGNVGNLTIKNSSVVGNTALNPSGAGGGIDNGLNGVLTIVSSTIANNSAVQSGGGINSIAAVTVINSTISGNKSDLSGGGVNTNGVSASLTLINSTISNNRADFNNDMVGGGGGILTFQSTTTLQNTIVAGNFRGPGSTRDDIDGALVGTSSFNLIGDGTGMTGITNGTNGNQVGSSGSPIDAMLGPLASNGGPTQTHALLPTSTAIENGSNANLPADTFDLDGDANTAEPLPVDQRGVGFPRIAGSNVDIGAFELGQADLSITKTDGAASEVPGTSVTYTIVVTNNGPNTANGATVADTFPAILTGVTYTSVAAGGATGNTAAGTGNISDTLNMPSGSSVTYTVNATIQSSASGNLTNTATVTAPAGLFDPTPGNNSATDTDTLSPQADLAITKTDGSATEVPGTPVTYTITVTNSGPSDVSGANVSDIFPGAITGVTFTSVAAGGASGNTAAGSGNISDTVNMPSGSSITYTATGTIAASATGTLTNTATVTAPGGVTDPNPGNNSASDTDTLSPQADLSIVKTDGSTTEVPGTPVTYTITVTNSGPSAVSGATVADMFSVALTGVTFTSVAAGGATGNTAAGSGNISDTLNMPSGSSVTYTVNATIDSSATGSLINTATVTAPAGVTDPTPGNNSATDTDTLVASADVSVTKTDSPDPVQAGNNITYTITVTNNGPSDAQSLSLSDAVPANTTFVSVTTPAGWTRTDAVPVGGTGTVTFTRPTLVVGAFSVFTLVVNVNGATATGTIITNTASVSSSVADPTPGNNSATTTTTVQNQPNITIQDAQVVEPPSGQVNMIFTVTLSAPAPAGGVSMNFTTQDQAPAINHAIAGQDYTATSGMVTFAMGEQFKTILVPVLSDNNAAEANETFLVLLSNPVNGIITDGTATGTILNMDQPGTIVISELRTSGPGGDGDDFVEIYNNSNSPHTVNGTSGGYGLFKMGAGCSATPVLIGVIPNGTVIPARGHYLFVGSAYSLANYGGSGAASGDQTLSSDIESDRNVALFSTASLASIGSANRLDAVGFGSNTGGNCDLLREGTTLTPLSGSVLEYSYVRDECGKKGNPAIFGPCPTGGLPKDSNVNNDDFVFLDTQGTVTPAGQRLGAPGPQNLGSPRLNLNIAALLLDATKGAPAAPNRVRDIAAVGPNAANGTLSIRRRFENNTGAPVTRLRFRIVDISSLSLMGGVADLRALTSTTIMVSAIADSATCAATGSPSTQPCTVTVFGTAVETPPAQGLGGALNSSLSAGTITLATPLAPGASINLQFLLGVQQTGSFKFFFNVEALP